MQQLRKDCLVRAGLDILQVTYTTTETVQLSNSFFFVFREIVGYPHLNECVNSLEILNIGGSNVLGEFIPFLFLHTPKLKSLGQWLNTMIYGLEILKVINIIRAD